MNKLRIGLALGSGAARGWAHIGILRALEEQGLRPDLICGTSVGALVGGAWLTDQLDDLQQWAEGMGMIELLKLIDITFSRGGLVAVEKAFERFRNEKTDIAIETLPIPFATVATDIATGREIWLREGHLLDVVRASAAMPGLFPAVEHDGQWLVDGALVNPVPVSVCRAMGADVVIAVNLNGDLSTLPRLAAATAAAAIPGAATAEAVPPDTAPPLVSTGMPRLGEGPFAQMLGRVTATVGERTRSLAQQVLGEKQPMPNVLEILAGSIDIMQDRITRSRLAGEPPDVLIQPRLGHIGILDFDRAEELIAIGHAAAVAMRPAIDFAVRRG
ncbi:patatin-like phospholipase family protein [Rhodospirillum centenum]|uniref:Patatin-like phospholipase family protein n=1 Tax=Rhodospirillum centenum (strain ATCC 51521 / SW) TaxID=414684 RepID=B6INK6_RHOCS|nr:patatin-like phospholipase family protein [Rhodospirillum centenum]ACI99103.1 patatin-like phospholipase family protein [Rhodospirillum centenum SW]